MKSSSKKRMSTRVEIIGRFGVIFAVLIVAAILFASRIHSLSQTWEQDQQFTADRNRFQQAVADHYKWVYGLTASIAFDQEFTGTTDPTQCVLGQFLYSDTVQHDPQWASFLSAIEPVHKEMHSGAQYIATLQDAELVKQEFSENIQPNINAIVNILNQEIVRLDEAFAESRESNQMAIRSLSVTVAVQMLVLLVLLFLVFMYIGRHIAEPIMDLEKKCRLLAEGNLSVDFSLDVCKNADLQNLAASLNKASEELKKYVVDIDRAMGEMSRRNLNVHPSQPFIGDFQPIEASIGQMLVDLT
ncbi:MAG: CZB domain-containing protein, partial [Anaerotignum sp.]|nr:CZB domain-containing protein [Anaerotignum sp.]